MFDLNIFYYLFSAGIAFLLAFLLWQFNGKKMMWQKKKTAQKVSFGKEKIFVSNDLLLEMFQFGNFRTVGTNFCLVNRRWSQLGQWHCQNRPHRIPKLILSFEEEEGRPWYNSGKWKKNAFLRSWHQQNASEEKLVNVPAKIPKNYEKIQMLLIEFPYDCEIGLLDWGNKLKNFIFEYSAHMGGACRIDIRWNGVKAARSYDTQFYKLFLASICQLREIHFVFEAANREFAQSYELYLFFIKWLLGNKNERKKDVKTARKLKLMNINSWNVDWYLKAVREEFYNKMEKMSTFDVLFLLLENNARDKEINVKNTKTGQIFYSKCWQIDGRTWVFLGICNSMAELDDESPDFGETAENLPTIQWNMRPGKYYIEMKEKKEKEAIRREKEAMERKLKEEEERRKEFEELRKKLNPPPPAGFVEILKQV